MHATYHAFFHPSKLEKWLTHVKSFSISLHEVQFIGKYFWKNVFWNIFFEKISLFNYETCLNFVIMHVESRMLSNWPHKIICGVYIIDIIMLFMLIKCYQLWISISLMNPASWYYIQPCKTHSWMQKKIKNTMSPITQKI